MMRVRIESIARAALVATPAVAQADRRTLPLVRGREFSRRGATTIHTDSPQGGRTNRRAGNSPGDCDSPVAPAIEITR